MIFGEIMDNRLHRKGLSTKTDEYLAIDRVPETDVIVVDPVENRDDLDIDDIVSGETNDPGSIRGEDGPEGDDDGESRENKEMTPPQKNRKQKGK
jgi:hypothetical protein